MILCDFLSRIQADNSDPHGLIPIAFNYIEHVSHPTCEFQAVYYNPREILTEFYRIEEIVGYAAMKVYSTQQINSYFVMTRGQVQAPGTSVPDVHGHSKPLDPNLKPEKDNTLQKQVFTPTVNSGISTNIPSTTGYQPSVPKAIPPVQMPIKYIPPSSQVEFTPKVLDAGETMVLFNLPRPWILLCGKEKQPTEIEFATYKVVDRKKKIL